MDILITLLIYIVVFAVVHFCVIGILTFMESPPPTIKIAKAIMYGVFLILTLMLVFGGDPGYLPRWHWK